MLNLIKHSWKKRRYRIYKKRKTNILERSLISIDIEYLRFGSFKVRKREKKKNQIKRYYFSYDNNNNNYYLYIIFHLGEYLFIIDHFFSRTAELAISHSILELIIGCDALDWDWES